MRQVAKASKVWEFMEKCHDGQKVKCTLCNKMFSNCKNTSNLLDHLKRRHDEEINNMKNDSIVEVDDPSSHVRESTVENTLGLDVASMSKSTSLTQKQKLRQTKLFVTNKKSELAKLETEAIDNSLLKMITLDYQPFSIVEDIGFREYTRHLNPLYNIPSRKTVTSRLLPEMYEKVRKDLQQTLAEVKSMSLTTDIWTSVSNKAYLCVTCHFVYDDVLRSCVLKTEELATAHTSENIATELSNILQEYNISEDKIVVIVSDNAANVKKAVISKLSMNHHSCIAHTLNLIVNQAIKENPEVLTIFKKCRSIVGHFKHSVQATEKLLLMQKQMGMPQLKVKQDVITRWNSSLIMIERLFSMKEPLSATLTSLKNAPQLLSSMEWNVIEDCIPLLKPFESLTTVLSGQKYCTVSSIIPLILGIKFLMSRTNVQDHIVEKLKQDLLKGIRNRYELLESDVLRAKATFLDPRFKMTAFESEEMANDTKESIKEEVSELLLQEKNEGIIENDAITQPTISNSIWALFDEKASKMKVDSTTNVKLTAKNMVDRYIEIQLQSRDSNPFQNYISSVQSIFVFRQRRFRQNNFSRELVKLLTIEGID